MSERIRVVIVGCGNIARHAHVPAWLANPAVEIVGLCDPDIGAVRQITERYGLKCHLGHDLDSTLSAIQPDVLDICTPGFLHVAQAMQALNAGCHVLVEKPPAASLAEAKNLADLARLKGLN